MTSRAIGRGFPAPEQLRRQVADDVLHAVRAGAVMNHACRASAASYGISRQAVWKWALHFHRDELQLLRRTQLDPTRKLGLG